MRFKLTILRGTGKSTNPLSHIPTLLPVFTEHFTFGCIGRLKSEQCLIRFQLTAMCISQQWNLYGKVIVCCNSSE